MIGVPEFFTLPNRLFLFIVGFLHLLSSRSSQAYTLAPRPMLMTKQCWSSHQMHTVGPSGGSRDENGIDIDKSKGNADHGLSYVYGNDSPSPLTNVLKKLKLNQVQLLADLFQVKRARKDVMIRSLLELPAPQLEELRQRVSNDPLFLAQQTSDISSMRISSIPSEQSLSSVKEVLGSTANFKERMEVRSWFVDNSRYIPLIMKEEQTCFFRPQRFGKTLFVSMMRTFHDLQTSKEEFDAYFSHLDVIKKDGYTRGSRSFVVLSMMFDFPVIGTVKDIDQAFTYSMNRQIQDSLEFYDAEDSVISKVIDQNDASTSLQNFASWVQKCKGGKLMILIDEYDRAMNQFMVDDLDGYQAWQVHSKESSSVIRRFFFNLKNLGQKMEVYRLFVTGISPLFLKDISGFNALMDLTNDETFSEMLGFTLDDVKSGLKAAGIEDANLERAAQVVQKWCDGYRFYESNTAMFNPFLCATFLRRLSKSLSLRTNLIEGKVTAINFATTAKTSSQVVKIASSTPHCVDLAWKLQTNETVAISALCTGFSLSDLLSLDDSQESYDRAASFLYYYGILTFVDGSKSALRVPNPLIRSETDNQNLAKSLSALRQFILTFKTAELHKAVQKIVDDAPSNYLDDTFSESAFSVLVQPAFNSIDKDLKVNFEYQYSRQDNENDDNDQFADIRLETSSTVILIELKRIRPNAVYAPRKGKQQFNRWDLAQLKEWQSNVEVETLLASPIRVALQKAYRASTVQEVLDKAESQVKGYALAEETLQQQGEGVRKTVKCYVLMLVAFRVVAKAVDIHDDVSN